MPDTKRNAGLSRRSLFKYGLLGSLAVVTGVGGGSSIGFFRQNERVAGMRVLRQRDLYFLRALIPALLQDAVSAREMPQAIDKTLRGMDYSLSHLSPAMLVLTEQLLVTLSLPLSRVPLSGIWGRWENVSYKDIHRFLQRWQNSPLPLLKMGHNSLLQLVAMGWYGNAESWQHCGYPGPPKI